MLAWWIGAHGGGMMQLTLASVGFDRYAKRTRRAAFLAEMEVGCAVVGAVSADRAVLSALGAASWRCWHQ